MQKGQQSGVGLGMKPAPVYLKAGDVVTLGIEGLGEQRQRVVGSKGRAARVVRGEKSAEDNSIALGV